jgi:hypothetical protein
MKTPEERKAILEKEIRKYVSDEWRVMGRTDTTCRLIKEKQPNGCLLVFFYMLFILPGIIYMTTYKGSKRLYLEVNEEGEIKYLTDDISSVEQHEGNPRSDPE